MDPFSKLPIELVSYITAFLTVDDFKVCLQVSKDWREKLLGGGGSVFWNSLPPRTIHRLAREFRVEEENGVRLNWTTSLLLYKKAAYKGVTASQSYLGLYCRKKGNDSKEGKEVWFAQSIKWFTRAAEAGRPSALRHLGKFYSKGLGVKQNHEKAHELWLKSAELGHELGMLDVALAYLCGRGTPTNSDEGTRWLKRGMLISNNYLFVERLALQYKIRQVAEELKVPDFDVEACRLFRLAVGLGSTHCCYRLGFMYECGCGIKKDKAEAIRYYRLGDERGCPFSQDRLGDLHLEGDGVEKDEKLAFDYYLKAAPENNSAYKQVFLCYWRGIGVERNIHKAFQYCKHEDYKHLTELLQTFLESLKPTTDGMASFAENISSVTRIYEYILPTVMRDFIDQSFLYRFYSSGKLKDSENFLKISHALDNNLSEFKTMQHLNPMANQLQELHQIVSYVLGVTYEIASPGNPEKAFEYYVKGAELGYDIAECSVARCYEMGIGVLQNSSKALEIYRKLSQKNHGPAWLNLARVHELGTIVEKNSCLATSYIVKTTRALNARKCLLDVQIPLEHALVDEYQSKNNKLDTIQGLASFLSEQDFRESNLCPDWFDWIIRIYLETKHLLEMDKRAWLTELMVKKSNNFQFTIINGNIHERNRMNKNTIKTHQH
eukprot:m.297499 g.297499  ORF g.297499 m.297499 type:complete len:663 (+) comp16400_c0_seq13:138-2126(+)